MRISSSNRNTQSVAPQVTTKTNRKPTISIVDPRVNDYDGWGQLAQANGAQLVFFASAEEALRFALRHEVDLWVVNANLPGLSGFELTGMIKTRSPKSIVYFVADEYAPEAERKAWGARASLFSCKPTHREWLGQWFLHQSTNVAPVHAATRLSSP